MPVFPGVSTQFAQGGLGILAPASDSVFAVFGPSLFGQINTVIPITDPNSIADLLGQGELPQSVAQILASTQTLVLAVPTNKSPGSVGSVVGSRVGSPTMVITDILGIPGSPVAASANNTGSGTIVFDATSRLNLGSSNTDITVAITTAGNLSAVRFTVTIGSNGAQTGQQLTNGKWTDVTDSSGIVLDFSIPLGGSFKVSDQFIAYASPNDEYNVLITIVSISPQGNVLWTYSLDGGTTTSAPIPAQLGCNVVAAGLAPPALAISGSAPSAAHALVLKCTQSGAAYGVTAQCSPSTGHFTPAGGNTGNGVLIVDSLGTSGSEAFTTTQTIVCTVTTMGAADTAIGTFVYSGGSPITGQSLASTDFDPTSALGIELKATTGTFQVGDVLTIVVQPQATFTAIVDGGSPTTGLYLSAAGVISAEPVSGPILTFAHTNVDLFTFSSGNPSSTDVYNVSFYPSFAYVPKESNGVPVGLNFAFGFGAYQVSDQYACPITGPSTVPSDALTALQDALATQGIDFSMTHFACGLEDFADCITLSGDVQSTLNTQAASFNRFISSVVYGPDLSSSTAGATPNDFISALGSSAFDRVMLTCGADYITSALTGRLDLRNVGYVISPRLAAQPIQIDPGEWDLGGLPNDQSTTTPIADADEFYANRGTTTLTVNGKAGIFCYGGLTLAAPGSDYGSIMNRRVIDKVAKYGYLALTNYVNKPVLTFTNAATMPPTPGCLAPLSAQQINSDVQSQILSALQGSIQGVNVNASITTNLFQNNGVEPVTISVQPFAYLKTIKITLGFTPSLG